MTSIAALAPILLSTDLPASTPGGGEAFAPVLAGLLTPAPTVCAVAPPLDTILPGKLAPEPSLPVGDAEPDAALPLPATISEAVARPLKLPNPLPPAGTALPPTGRNRPDDLPPFAPALPRARFARDEARDALPAEPRSIDECAVQPVDDADRFIAVVSDLAVVTAPPAANVLASPIQSAPLSPDPIQPSAPPTRSIAVGTDDAPIGGSEPRAQPDPAAAPTQPVSTTAAAQVTHVRVADSAPTPAHPVAKAVPAAPMQQPLQSVATRTVGTPAARSGTTEPVGSAVRVAREQAFGRSAAPATVVPPVCARQIDIAREIGPLAERSLTSVADTARPASMPAADPLIAVTNDPVRALADPLAATPSSAPVLREQAYPTSPAKPVATIAPPVSFALPRAAAPRADVAQPASAILLEVSSPSFTASLPQAVPPSVDDSAPLSLTQPALAARVEPITNPSPAVAVTAAPSLSAVTVLMPAAIPLSTAAPVASVSAALLPLAPTGVGTIAQPIAAPSPDRIREPVSAVAVPRLVQAAPVPSLDAAPVIRPAFQAFGAALHRAAAFERKPVPATVEPLFALSPAVSTPAPNIVAPVDTTQARWPEAMMARVELVRELQNQGDTRIRLHPDALGHIDVAVRREGEAVHVHLAAAESATRALLAEAQPRLAELAEAKGLKLAQSSVDAGPGQGGERRQPAQPQPQTPSRPAAAVGAADDPTDTRLA